MPWLTFGQIRDPSDPKLQPPPWPDWATRGTTAEIELTSRIQKAVSVLIGLTKGGEYRKLAEGYAADLKPRSSATPAERAAAYVPVSWLYEMTTPQIQAVYPLAAADVIAEARQLLWIEGLDADALRAQTLVQFQADIPVMEQMAERTQALMDETDRYLDWVHALLKQFETYLAWKAHHERKKAHVTKNISQALQWTARIAQYVPYVGWAIAAAATAADVGVQVNGMREAVKALNEIGERGVILEMALQVYEPAIETRVRATNFLSEVLLAIGLREQFLRDGGTSIPLPQRPDGVRAASRRGGRRPLGTGTKVAIGTGVAAAAVALLAAFR